MCKVLRKTFIRGFVFFHNYSFFDTELCNSRCIAISNLLEDKVPPLFEKSELKHQKVVSATGNKNFKRRNKTSAVDYLKKTFEINTWDATQIITKYKRITQVSPKLLSINYNICVKNEINPGTILRYPLVLSERNLQEKINDLKKLPKDLNVLVPLLILSRDKVQQFVENESGIDRIAILRKIFKISEMEVIETLQKRPFLISLDLERIEEIVNILTGYGISTQDVLNDVWVLRYRPEAVKERLEMARENNVENFKTWMIRCPELTLDRHVKRRYDNKVILGDHSLVEYLSEKLECSEEEAKYLITKQPALECKSVSKINKMIDFLISYGFKSSQIKRAPKILLHSVETTKKRLNELESCGAVLEHLSILTKSQKQYLQYFESLKPSKNKTQKCKDENKL